MGGAASISVMPPSSEVNELRALLRDKKKLNKMYKEICNHGHEKTDGRIYLKSQISLPELILYMNKEDRDPVLREFSKDPEVIKVAFRHCDQDVHHKTKKKMKDTKNDMLSKREFRKLLPTLYLFTHLFMVFEVGDCAVHDRKIFPKEFLTGKSKIEAIEEVSMHDVSDEQWANEFPTIDKNKNGYISFDEFCAYVVKNIIQPQFFIHLEAAEDSDSEGETPRADSVADDVAPAAAEAETATITSAAPAEGKSLGIAEIGVSTEVVGTDITVSADAGENDTQPLTTAVAKDTTTVSADAGENDTQPLTTAVAKDTTTVSADAGENAAPVVPATEPVDTTPGTAAKDGDSNQ